MSIHSFPAHDSGPHMTGTTWQSRLDGASSVDEVIQAARDFVAGFDPFEAAALPEPLHIPAKIVDADDISSYAFELVRYECPEGHPAIELVHKLAHFFSHASTRLARLAALDSVIVEAGRETA